MVIILSYLALNILGVCAFEFISIPSVIDAGSEVAISVSSKSVWEYYRLYLMNDDEKYLISRDIPLCIYCTSCTPLKHVLIRITYRLP